MILNTLTSLYCDHFIPPILRFFVANAASHPNTIPKLLTVSALPPPFRTTSGGRNPVVIPMAAAPESVKAEYAKSNRSSCRACSKLIENKSLRLGLVSKDKGRGFEDVKWHHLTCFPLPSPFPPHAVAGFSSLESSDQEAVKELFASGDNNEEKVEVSEATENLQNQQKETEENDSKKRKVSQATEDIQNEQEETEKSDSKKRKVVSIEAPESVKVEYAKSNRSSCKACSKLIEKSSLRLGLVSKDKSRGFEAVKWHHLTCFPLPSPFPPHAVTGFSSLKSSDQEAVTELFASHENSEEKVSKTTEDSQTEQKETEESSSKNRKSSTSDVKAVVDISFSVSDVMSMYKDATLLPNWKAVQTVIFLERDEGLHDSSKIAAFDFDGCLANTAVNRVGPDAWSLMYPSIPDKLQSLYNNGYKLVIFTNESNIERWKKSRQKAVDSKIGRLNNFIKEVKVPIQVFIACGLGNSGKAAGKEDPFRKPKPGMWRLLERHFNSGIAIDMDQSFYVGDAAGRKSDHSDADIKFAEAIGLKFYLPEEYFVV